MDDARRERFWRDKERIIGSRAFRRLAGKTQVVALPSDPLVRTRLTHTLDVSSIAGEITRGLRGIGLIEPLVEAIALGHDLGHPAFGHAGERALAAIAPGGFHHATHGTRVVTILEPGLDLARETVDGILKHSKGRAGPMFGGARASMSGEARVVRAADLYAYACHDLDDAYLLGELRREDLPSRAVATFGVEPREVRRALVAHTVASSNAVGDICLEDEADAAFQELREFLYERLYEGKRIASQTAFVRSLVDWLWQAACDRPHLFHAALTRRGLLSLGPSAGEDRPPTRSSAGEDRPPTRSSVQEPSTMVASDFVDAVAAMTDRQMLEICRALRPPARVVSLPKTAAQCFPETRP